MTTTTIRTKVHKYIDEADAQVLEVVLKLLEVYKSQNASMLSSEQQMIVMDRAEKYMAGKSKGYSIREAKKILTRKKSK